MRFAARNLINFALDTLKASASLAAAADSLEHYVTRSWVYIRVDK